MIASIPITALNGSRTMNDCLTCNEKCIYYYGEAKGSYGHPYCSRFGIDTPDGLPCNSYEEPQEDTDHSICILYKDYNED